ncbi:RluA family pseudouridine synthase [Pseudodesulfovibrio sp.]|uniref:RluA family pseudouridine synthase n=1 Tax=Pseudodesulfovibrio sp. TaxID=2035812 RepID=UPI002604ADA2|nr:RluA family pseudouridine synthase [Pseudodesulfovibrio sp.]MDD3313451.1 RluA family pseudouridine synthase [Pseudodesulfovibrio sp.]
MNPAGDDLTILYADDDLVVVDKPSGLLSVPGKGEENQDCVVARVRARFPKCMEQPSVHRLDQDTSGLLLLALTASAHRNLSKQFMDRLVGKRYVALLDGVLEAAGGVVDLRFRLDPDDRPRQVYDPERGKRGVTRWRRLGVEDGRTRVEFMPQTGRTHQLRLHSAHEKGLGCPIVGDRLYGSGTGPGQLLLHASLLRFRHPVTGRPMEFASKPPF